MHNPRTQEFIGKLRKLETLAVTVEEALVAKAAALDASVTERASSLTGQDRDDLFEYYADDYFELNEELPTILRYAVLTAAVTALEVYLNDTVRTYAAVEQTRVRLKDMAGSGIERARGYLTKVAGVAFPDCGSTWSSICRLRDLRNCVVHADGVVGPSSTELRAWATRFRGVRVNPTGVVSLDQTFLEAAIGVYDDFANEFDESCKSLRLWRGEFWRRRIE